MSYATIIGLEEEFVIEDGIARWGKVGKKQKTIELAEVQKIHRYFDSDQSDELIFKDKSSVKLPSYYESKESGNFKEFIKKNSPDIRVIKIK